MNKYPFWWDKTVTIYNKIEDGSGRVSWQPATLTGCFWRYVNNVTYVNNVRMEVKQVICRVPKKDNYLSLEDWLSTAEKTGYFTLRNGDIVILGEVSDEVDEYTKGKHSTDLLKKYNDVNRAFRIETFVDDTGDGLCAEHYHLKGI